MALYSAPELIDYAGLLLKRAGLRPDMAEATAEILVEGDLLGHTTHGLQLLPAYLADIEANKMRRDGEPRVLADFPAALTWDGDRLPGPWLVRRAIAAATERAKQAGTCTVAIRRSHHIACLAAYLKPVTDQNLAVLLMCSDPTVGGVAPHGGLRDVYTPNPIAAGWPTRTDPVIFDVSQSITTHGMIRRTQAEKKRLPGKWLIDGKGIPTDDPSVMAAPADRRGALLPVGGVDHGHKGYALGLLVEMLTSGLSGFGRADPAEGWTANVFLQVMSPALFGGTDDFLRQMSWLSDACRAVPPREGFDRVRLPGESALQKRAAQVAKGVDLHPAILPALAPWGEKLAVAAPIAR